MFAALSVRRVSNRRLTFFVLTTASLFILGFTSATTPIVDYVTRHPFFTQYTHHDDNNELPQAFFDSNGEEEKLWSQISDLNGFCTPEQYSAGYWHRRPQSLLRPMLTPEDVYPISGFQGCASFREVEWHLAKNWYDEEEIRVRPWRGNVSAYDWIPGSGCETYSKPTQEQLVTQLVERGGWLILGGMSYQSPTFFDSGSGSICCTRHFPHPSDPLFFLDSISENHFFSLSCMLYPHVKTTPDYNAPNYYDHGYQQDLFLEKTSPLVPYLRFPKDFDIDTTPLVTFRR